MCETLVNNEALLKVGILFNKWNLHKAMVFIKHPNPKYAPTLQFC